MAIVLVAIDIPIVGGIIIKAQLRVSVTFPLITDLAVYSWLLPDRCLFGCIAFVRDH